MSKPSADSAERIPPSLEASADSVAFVPDPLVAGFLQHLAADRGASSYTQRNYRQALADFVGWHLGERYRSPLWLELQRDDFRAYLRTLGRRGLGQAAIRLRFSALRGLYRFLVRRGKLDASPVRLVQLPKSPKRLPRFLTVQQMLDLLSAPARTWQAIKENCKDPGGRDGYPEFPDVTPYLPYLLLGGAAMRYRGAIGGMIGRGMNSGGGGMLIIPKHYM